MSSRWWLLLFLAALVLLMGAGFSLLGRFSLRPGAPVAAAEVDAGACPRRDELPAAVLPGEEDAAALVVAEKGVQLSIDGTPVPQGLTAPVRLKAGERAIFAQASGDELRLTLRVDPFRPVLLHAVVDPKVGLSLVFLGGWCASCPGAEGAPALGTTAATEPTDALLRAAAGALCKSDWRTAHEALSAVPPAQRRSVTYARLGAAVMQSTRQSSVARALLQASGDARIRALMAQHAALGDAEDQAMGALAVRRWNLLTERYARLVELAPEAPGPVAAASARFGELSNGFQAASEQHRVVDQVEAVEAAGETIAVLVKGLRAARPADCALQERISRAF
ncbi:MAG: hypothetical protein K1X89_23240 [Myxococcaceae bacterium]|nr:hypothetical protein [Myxococcaceae bacterium]